MTAKRLNQWLRDAHVLDKQAEQVLSSQLSRIEGNAQVRDIRKHLEETKGRARRNEVESETPESEDHTPRNAGKPGRSR